MLRRFIVLAVAIVALAALFVQGSIEKRVVLVLDGRASAIESTSFSVGQLLTRRGIHITDLDFVTPHPGSRLRDGLRIVVRRAPRVTVLVAGRREVVPVPLGTPSLRAALASARVKLGADDEVTPNLDSVPRHGMTVRVTRVTVEDVSQVEEVPYPTLTRFDPNMAVGTSRVELAGEPGQELVTYRVRREDGRITEREVVSTHMYALPREEYVVIGTHSRERQATWQQGESSWYERPGIGAAHRWLPKGTKVTVTNLATGASITVIIDDRGPYGVPGRILDLSREAFARLAPLAQGVFPVEIEW